MNFTPVPELPDVLIIEPVIFEDQRGFFTEMYHREKFFQAGIRESFVQDNLSRSRKGTIRGLHYQVIRPQAKIVWVLSGEVFDVAVDLRRSSPTFGKWTGTVLSDKNRKGLYIPPKFAHGFCVLSDEAYFYYKCSDFYSPSHERCIRWNDPDLAIEWPIQDPMLSEKDANAPLLKDAQLP
ncbi:MAG: dTDP-4-dehydrorhamnose 3,5-epimerase [Deltaproteobacteria bacterium]|nr:dTDP-4-dehydrorhamnose 3,5-epimerase [Deltaproteobacteria bacterium]